MDQPFDMPPTYPGLDVYWFPGKDKLGPMPAKVTSVGQSSLSLSLFVKDYPNLMTKDGVRHVDDPNKSKMHERERLGYWDYIPAATIAAVDRASAALEKTRAQAAATKAEQERIQSAKPDPTKPLTPAK